MPNEHAISTSDGESKRSVLLTNLPCPAEFNAGYSLESTLMARLVEVLLPFAEDDEPVCEIKNVKPEHIRGNPYSATVVFATVEHANLVKEHIRREDIRLASNLVKLGTMRWDAVAKEWTHDPNAG